MSCAGENWIVPSANPCNQSSGVQSVTAGTNVSITGTATNPIINSLTKLVSSNTPTQATLTTTLTEICNFGIVITQSSDLFISASINTTNINMNNAHPIITAGIYISLNGGAYTLVSRQFTDSYSGIGTSATTHNTFTFSVVKQPQAAGSLQISLRASATNITTPVTNLTGVNVTAIGQLQ